MSGQCGRECLIRLEPFSGPSMVTWLGCRSLVFPRLCIPVSIPSPSLCPVLLPAAGVAFHSILVAITVLGRRGFAVESAAARVCREAGARVCMDLARPDVMD